jgi:diacylglycerol kinase (ATP)
LSLSQVFYFDISKTDWLFQILAIGLVLSVEGLNTAVEKWLILYIRFSRKNWLYKDIAAGAVFFAALTAFAIGLIIYLPLFL